MVGPLMAVNPIGYRSIYPIHLLVILSTLDIENINIDYIYQLIVSAVIIVVLSFVYYRIHDAENKRMHYMLDHKNEEKMTIPWLPYKTFVRYEELDVREYQQRLSDFYHINMDIEYEIVDYDDWLSINK